MSEHEPIHITLSGDPSDPRDRPPVPDGVIVHYSPSLHPDDMVIGPGGIPMTSVSRTLIDLAEILDSGELRECFENARDRGLLDPKELAAARARVEWRPSLATLDELLAEFC